MVDLSKDELCEALAEDYADRAARNGLGYEDAFRQYLKRCMKRTKQDLMQQYTVQGLHKTGFIF